MQEDGDTNSMWQFVIPDCCPAQTAPTCFLTQASKDISQGFSTPQASKITPLSMAPHLSTSAVHAKKKRARVPLVESEVRRSARIQKMAHGYKGKTCFDKNCLACRAVEPPLNKNVVKNLSEKFGLLATQTEDKQGKPNKNVDAAKIPKKNKK